MIIWGGETPLACLTRVADTIQARTVGWLQALLMHLPPEFITRQVWTGSEMVIWAGEESPGNYTNTGADTAHNRCYTNADT